MVVCTCFSERVCCYFAAIAIFRVYCIFSFAVYAVSEKCNLRKCISKKTFLH